MNYYFCLLTILTLVSTAVAVTFTVYDDPGRTSTSTFLWWGGGASKKFTVDDRTCMNFNFYNDKISSIDPHGGCVKVWEHRSCSGLSMVVTDACGCSKNLEACDMTTGIPSEGETSRNWDNEISSISTCTNAEETEANRPVDNGDLANFDLVLVDSNSVAAGSPDLFFRNIISIWKHREQYFTVTLCKHTSCKRQEMINAQAAKTECANFGSTWDRQVSAVYTVFDCVEMFDGRCCTGESIKFKQSVNWLSVEELNPCRSDLSTCKLENGQSWSWNDRIRSMRRCLE